MNRRRTTITHVLIRHKVADYEKWKPLYKDHRKERQAAGLRDVHLWRNADDPSEVHIIFEVSDLAKAKEFAGSADLKEKMQAAGVQGKPEIRFLNESSGAPAQFVTNSSGRVFIYGSQGYTIVIPQDKPDHHAKRIGGQARSPLFRGRFSFNQWPPSRQGYTWQSWI